MKSLLSLLRFLPIRRSDGRRFVFSSSAAIHARMVFSNITKSSTDWRWEATHDGGKTWSVEITIKYTRERR